MESPSTANTEHDLNSSRNEVRPFLDSDGKNLELIARNTFMILGIIIIISGLLLGYKDTLSINLIWACIIAGVLGSTSSALISALQRKADGWETVSGEKHPPGNDKKGRFSQRMATFFLYRPIFGIMAGLLVFFGIQTNYFEKLNIHEEAKVIFYSLLSGLFIKSLIEKMKNLFDNLIGNSK